MVTWLRERESDELLNALKKVKSVGHGVIPKHVWMIVEEAIASIKEQNEPSTVKWRCPACNTDLKHEHAYDCVAIASAKEQDK